MVRSLKSAGPETTSYKDLILRYARLRGLERRMLILPYIPLWFMSLRGSDDARAASDRACVDRWFIK